MIIIGPVESRKSLDAYACRELVRICRQHWGIDVPAPAPGLERIADRPSAGQGGDAIVLGTRDNNPALRQLLESGFLPEPTHPQGYSMRAGPNPGNPRQWFLAIAGADAAGTLYALRDLEHYHLNAFRKGVEGLALEPFQRQDHPRIEYRGHWSWGCNMPDPKAWIDNMSRWKLNELIHWDNYPPARAREIVEFAHERGVRVVWGFGWGWCPDWNFVLPGGFDHGRGEGVQMCGSSEANLRFFREEILRKVREDYGPTGCDGLYFQAFTECPKCQCPSCAGRTMGELMLHFVNPIVDAIKREFPDLWISCGIHHDFGDFSFLRELDPRCNLLWENCASGTSLRGAGEDFGYIYKSIPYGAGYGKTCSADPDYTEESLREWMQSNARNYRVEGGLDSYYRYMSYLQKWGHGFLGKRSVLKHASVVADHAVFCRRTPFPHAALAEAQWNPGLDTKATVDGLLAFLGVKAEIERTPEPGRPIRDLEGKPPWLCDPDALTWSRDAWSSSG